jgi:hypothetical protein
MTIHNLEISTAHFTNNERTEIEVMLFSEDSTEDDVVLIPFSIEAKDGDADYDWLLSKIDIDQIHENTFNKFRRENEEFREMIIATGKEMELIVADSLEGNMHGALIDALFEEYDEEEMKESLFLIKLKVFEMDIIKTSKDRETKAKLRKAKTFIDVVKYTAMLISPEK